MFMTFHALIDFDPQRMTRIGIWPMPFSDGLWCSTFAVFMAGPRIQSQFMCAHKNNLECFKQNTLLPEANANCLASLLHNNKTAEGHKRITRSGQMRALAPNVSPAKMSECAGQILLQLFHLLILLPTSRLTKRLLSPSSLAIHPLGFQPEICI